MSEERRKVSLASNASDGLITNFTPFSSDQMIRNLSMKIGEVDSGSARLLCVAYHFIWAYHLVAADGGEICYQPITRVAR